MRLARALSARLSSQLDPAPNELHNLELIPFPESCLRPASTRYDIAVQLDRNPVRLHAKSFD